MNKFRKDYKKAKHTCIPPEEMLSGRPYTFSFNPEHQPLSTEDSLKLEDWFEVMLNLFNRLDNCHLYIVPEISKGGRLHWHGVIKVKEIYKFFLRDIPLLKNYGTYEIDELQDPDVWRTYMFKGHNYMMALFRSLTVKYDYIYESLEIGSEGV